MAREHVAARIRTGIWVLVSGIILQGVYEGTLGDRAHESVHLPVAQALRQTLGEQPAAPPRLRIISDADFQNPAAENVLPAPAPLSTQQWQNVLDALASSAARNVYIAHSFAGEAAQNLRPRASWSHLALPWFLSTNASTESAAPQDGASVARLTGPFQGRDRLVGPAQHLVRATAGGHLGPWSPYSMWPYLTTEAAEGTTGGSRHFVFAPLPQLERTSEAVRLADRWFELSSPRQLYTFPLTAQALASVTTPLRTLAQDPAQVLATVGPDEVILVQERKLWGHSPSLESEVAATAGMIMGRINGNFVMEAPWVPIYLLLLAIATVLCAFVLAPRHFILVAGSVLLVQVLVQPFLLAFSGVLMPWTQIAFVDLPAALLGGFVGTRQEWLATLLLRDRLRPSFSEKDARRIAQTLDLMDEDSATSERLVSLVDVDVVGFSKTVENTLPEESTRQISLFLNELFAVIHSHGGFVSDYSPERILAVFGHGLGGKRPSTERSHVRTALECAKGLQAKSVELMHALGTGVTSPFPVRIAINSCMVRLGLVHVGDRLEFKTIGSGVALARQLSGHCEPFRILLSSSSAEILKVDEETEFAKLGLERSMGSGESPELTTVFELDPFADDRELLNKATEIFRSYNNIKREDNRFGFPRGAEPLLRSAIGQFEVLDFSLTGLRLRSRTFLTSGSAFQAWPAEFDNDNAPFKMSFEVHWGAPDKASPSGRDRFFLGVRYTGHSQDELVAMVEYFHRKLALTSAGVAEPHVRSLDEEWAS